MPDADPPASLIPEAHIVPSALEQGVSALAAARWQEAHDLLVPAVAESPTGVALEALGEACSWLDDVHTIEVRERAYRRYREERDARGAARARRSPPAFDHLTFRGEAAVGQGWLELAARALVDVPLSAEHGHLAVREADFAISVDGDPVVGAAKAAEAIRVGRELGIPDVELIGRAQEGITLVLRGRISEGMRLLDSAAAAAMAGEIVDPAYAGYAVCYVINACEMARDSHCAAQWCLQLDGHCRKVGLKALQQICRSEYAGVLVEQGDWVRAEAEIMGAAADLTGRGRGWPVNRSSGWPSCAAGRDARTRQPLSSPRPRVIPVPCWGWPRWRSTSGTRRMRRMRRAGFSGSVRTATGLSVARGSKYSPRPVPRPATWNRHGGR